MEQLKQIETELTRIYHLLTLANTETEAIAERNGDPTLIKIQAVLAVANEHLLEQLDDLSELTIKKDGPEAV